MAHFYQCKLLRRFIHHYSTLTSPLTTLLKGQPKSLSWTMEAPHAFQKLKEAFTTPPILIHYDIRNRELLAIKLTLGEWWHWLERLCHSFLLLMDHKNLEYLRDEK